MKIPLSHLHEPIAFRFSADFEIRIQTAEIAGFTSQQKTLLQAIAASPVTLRRIACMALETDLAGVTGKHLSNLFEGPCNEEILEKVLPCLSEADKVYWLELKDGPGDTLHEEIVPVFLAFEVRLRQAGLEELPAALESTRKSADEPGVPQSLKIRSRPLIARVMIAEPSAKLIVSIIGDFSTAFATLRRIERGNKPTPLASRRRYTNWSNDRSRCVSRPTCSRRGCIRQRSISLCTTFRGRSATTEACAGV